jgi:hypothetical protein
MDPIIGASITLITELVKSYNTNNVRKYIDRVSSLRLDIKGEEERGYDADDAKIESLYKELKIALDALQTEVSLYNAKK